MFIEIKDEFSKYNEFLFLQQLYYDLVSGTRAVLTLGHLLDDRIFLVIGSREEYPAAHRSSVFDDFYFYEIEKDKIKSHTDGIISKVILSKATKLTSRFKSIEEIPKDLILGSMLTYNFNRTNYLLLWRDWKSLSKYSIATGIQEKSTDELSGLPRVSTNFVGVSAGVPSVLYALMTKFNVQSIWQFTLEEVHLSNRSTETDVVKLRNDASCPVMVRVNCTRQESQQDCTSNVTITSGYSSGENGTFYLFASSFGSEEGPRVVTFRLPNLDCSNPEQKLDLSIRTLKFDDFFAYHEPAATAASSPRPPRPDLVPSDDYESRVVAIVTASVTTILVLTFFAIGCFFYCAWEHRRPKPDKPLTKGRWCQNPATVIGSRRRVSTGRPPAADSAAVALHTAVEKRRKRNYPPHLRPSKTGSISKDASEQKLLMPKTGKFESL